MRKICHITTLHPRDDVRIFHKECKSLTKKYEVHLIVADGKGDEITDAVHICDIGLRQPSRLKRIRIDSKKALKKAVELDCELYHFHDPELIRIGVSLIKQGKKVIYDAHEDLPRQIMSKPYIKDFIKPLLAFFVEWQENRAVKKFNYICSATPYIRDRFKIINKNTVDINNYPIIGELQDVSSQKVNAFCYTGGITEERGIINFILALRNIDTKILLAGNFDSKLYMDKIRSLPEWNKVEFLGLVDRKEVGKIMSKSIAGIVTFLAMPNHINAQPNKIFEYMSSSIPVIGSNFDLWRSIIEDNNCGICVNPDKPEEIAAAMKYLQQHPDKAKLMGENGKRVVQEKYNWQVEEKKLFEVYNKVLNK